MMKPEEDYGVEVVTAYEFKRVGQVFFPPGLLRDALIRSGRVRRLTKADQQKPVEDIREMPTAAARVNHSKPTIKLR